MDILTNLAIPYEVYLFYQKIAAQLDGCCTEDVIVDALTRYAAMISEEIIKNKNTD